VQFNWFVSWLGNLVLCGFADCLGVFPYCSVAMPAFYWRVASAYGLAVPSSIFL